MHLQPGTFMYVFQVDVLLIWDAIESQITIHCTCKPTNA